MCTTQPTRILAVEIRAARLGYAVFESPRGLTDFGGACFPVPRAARSRIARLLRLYRPSVVVLPGPGARYPRNMPIRKAIARIARDEARKAAIPIARVSEREIKSNFERYSCRDKYDVAALVASKFPDISWRLPPRPKFYDPEPSSMLYFDSIALGVSYQELTWQNNKKPIEDDGIFSPASK